MKTITSKITGKVILTIGIIGILILTVTPIKAQTPAVVDSLSHTYSNGTLSVYLRLFRTAGFDIFAIQTQILNDTLKMDVCIRNHGTGSPETHDTTVQIAIVNNQVPNNILVSLYDNDTSTCFNSPPYGTSNYVLSVNELNAKSNLIKVFPNPTSGLLNLELKNSLKTSEIVFYNLLGKKVKTYNVTERKLNIKEMPSGQYILKIKTDEGLITKKVMIK